MAIKKNDVSIAHTVQVIMTHRGIRIIHKGKNTDWPDQLSYMDISYIEKKINSDDTMPKV